MKNNNKIVSLLVVAVLLGSTWVWGVGCDVTAVDEGTGAPLEELLTSVSTAESEAAAGKEIRKLLNKTEVGVVWRKSLEAGPYDAYVFSDAQLAVVAAAQARFNAGDLAEGRTVRAVFEEVLATQAELKRAGEGAVFAFTPPAIEASLDEVLQSFYVLSRQALAAPDDPEKALILSITAERVALPDSVGDVPLLRPDQVLSPMQRTLFTIWLHENGPSLPLYDEDTETTTKSMTGNPNLSCPNGTELLAKFNWNGSKYVFEKPSGNQGKVTISSNSTSKSGSWTSTVAVDRVILKGGTDTDVINAGNKTSGTFNNNNLVHGQYGKSETWGHPAISNIQFCYVPKPPPPPPTFESCKFCCLAEYVICKLCGGKECETKAKACIDECHDQGG